MFCKLEESKPKSLTVDVEDAVFFVIRIYSIEKMYNATKISFENLKADYLKEE